MSSKPCTLPVNWTRPEEVIINCNCYPASQPITPIGYILI